MKIKIFLFLTIIICFLAFTNNLEKHTAMDKIEIIELINQYAKNTDLANAKGSADMFTEDGMISSLAGTDHGKANILKHLEQVATTVAKGKRHTMVNITSDIQGDHATSSSYMVVIDATNSAQIIMTCVYEDVLVKENGAWKFKSRKLTIDPSFKPPVKK